MSNCEAFLLSAKAAGGNTIMKVSGHEEFAYLRTGDQNRATSFLFL